MPVQSPARQELNFLGSRARVLVDGAETNGRLGLIDMIEVPAGEMPPPHVHHAEDEGFYILDGEVTLYLPGEEIECSPGDFVLAPRGVPHAYRIGDRAARWLVMSIPAGFERFDAAVSALSEADPATLTAVAAEHEIEVLGPPGGSPKRSPTSSPVADPRPAAGPTPRRRSSGVHVARRRRRAVGLWLVGRAQGAMSMTHSPGGERLANALGHGMFYSALNYGHS